MKSTKQTVPIAGPLICFMKKRGLYGAAPAIIRAIPPNEPDAIQPVKLAVASAGEQK
jgi:hypothetical protein